LWKPNAPEHAGRRANGKYAASLAGPDLSQHVFNYGSNELWLFDTQSRYRVVGDVACDDRSNPHTPFVVRFPACDSRARGSHIDPERE
jgi:hypothetical protein